MTRSQVLKISFLSVFFLLIVNQVALSINLFWAVWWMDLVLHFLGGLVIGSVIISLFARRSDPFLYMAGVVTTITMIVALGWEGYEFFAQIAYARNYIVDTLTDIGFGLAGALTMTIFAHAILNRKKKN